MDLRLYLLGAPRLELEQRSLTIDRSKALALLAYLAMQNQPQTRDRLAGLLWPDHDAEHAYAYLRRTLWSLREPVREAMKNGEPTWLEIERDTISVRAGSLWVDARQFQELLQANQAGQQSPAIQDIQTLQAAVNLYQGDFMAGFTLRDAPAYDSWQVFLTENLRLSLSQALERLAQSHAGGGDYESALAASRRRVSLDPLDENAHRQLITLYAQAGQRSAALRQYQECERLLLQELGAAPHPETRQLIRQIRSGAIQAAPTSNAKLAETAQAIGQPAQAVEILEQAPGDAIIPLNLPVPPTPFVGRKIELARIITELEHSDCRLLTFLGPGGIGKTRLAIEAARSIIQQTPEKFPQGGHFVGLASLSTSEALVPVIAETLGFTFLSQTSADRTLEAQTLQLLDYLKNRQMLLVLDNFEHLVEGAGLISKLLTAAPRLKILVTSRVRLNLAEEWIFEIPGMHFPERGAAMALEEYSAIRLFLQGARRARLDFTYNEQDLLAIAHICRLVQGVPLAIELASTWVRMLSCQEIVAEIGTSLDFLSGSLRSVPDRHKSLRTVFNHSWQLLTEEERQVLQMLSLFQSGFRREAAQAVAKASLPMLLTLVDQSLLKRTGGERFEIHELIKQFAAEKLRISNGEEAVRNRLAAYYAELLDRLEGDLRTERQIAVMKLIDYELEDIRAAWRWSVEQGDAEHIIRMVSTLAWYYYRRGRYQNGLQDFKWAANLLRLLHQALGDRSKTGSQNLHTALAFTLAVYGLFLRALEDWESAREIVRESLTQAEQQNSSERAWLFLFNSLGAYVLPDEQVRKNYYETMQTFKNIGESWGVAIIQVATPEVVAVIENQTFEQVLVDSLDTLRQSGDSFSIADCLFQLSGDSYFHGRYAQARRYAEQALEMYHTLQAPWREADIHFHLGGIAAAEGNYLQARSDYQRSIALYRELGTIRRVTANTSSLGYIHYLLKAYEQAEKVLLENLQWCEEIQINDEKGMVLYNLGMVYLEQGDLQKAEQMLSEAVRILKTIKNDWRPAVALRGLGSVMIAKGDHAQAWKYYLLSLKMMRADSNVIEILELATGFAELLAAEGKEIRAIEILAMCQAHPATFQKVRGHTEHLLETIATRLPAEQAAQAQERGRLIDPFKLAQELLQERQSDINI